MTRRTFALWVYLSRTPLLSLTVTLVAYLVADRVSARTDRHPPANPVLHAIWSIDALLVASRTPYSTYFVTIRWRVATGSAILIAQAFGAPPMVLIALAPKSVTARRDGNNVSARRGSGAHRRPSDRDRYHSRRRGHPADETLSAA